MDPPTLCTYSAVLSYGPNEPGHESLERESRVKTIKHESIPRETKSCSGKIYRSLLIDARAAATVSSWLPVLIHPREIRNDGYINLSTLFARRLRNGKK